MAAHGGVKRLAQVNYEKGLRKPDTDYLLGIANAGADVDYILTGIRADPIAKELAEIEKLLEANTDIDSIKLRLNLLRPTATAMQQRHIDLILDLLGDKNANKRRLETIEQVGERLRLSKELSASVIARADWVPPAMVIAILETAIFEGLGHRGAETVLDMLKILTDHQKKNGSSKTGNRKAV